MYFPAFSAHRRGLIYRFFGLATLREVIFEKVNLEQLQDEFRVEEKNTENDRNIEELPAKFRYGTYSSGRPSLIAMLMLM
jgi:hypothetical protein